MKALVKRESKVGLWLENDIPVPEMGDDDVLIRIHKTSICGTDVHIYKWDDWAQKTIPVPMVVGHEYVGEIAKIGKHVKGLKVGDRVCGEGHIVCGHCPNCLMGKKHFCLHRKGVGVNRPGGFAEYLVIPAENVFVLPDSIPDDVASIFDPYGNAVHTALAFSLIGEDVLITGAGPIGIMAVAIAKFAGARNVVITDINEYRLDLARKMGATLAVNIKEKTMEEVMKALDLQDGFTVGLEMSGHPNGLSTCLEKVRHGGNIALLGILPPDTIVDWDLIIFKLLTIKGIYGRGGMQNWFQMVHLLEGGLNLNPIITHHFSADDFEEGFKVMLSGNSGKVILNWT